jgi:hypothetical protein
MRCGSPLAWPALGLLCLLTACGAPRRLAVDWSSYTTPLAADRIVLPLDLPSADRKVRQTAAQMSFTVVLADERTGSYTFTRADPKFANIVSVLSVGLWGLGDGSTQLRVRGYAFGNSVFPPAASKAFPSDGSIEKEFMQALEKGR